MNRRHVLRLAGTGLAAGLAGCSGGGENGGNGAATERTMRSPTPARSPPTERTPTESPSPTGRPTESEARQTTEPTADPSAGAPAGAATVSVADTSPARDAPVRYTVAVTRPRRDRPPVLRTRIENTRDELVRLGEGEQAQHLGIWSRDRDLFLPRPAVMHQKGDDCWGLERATGRNSAFDVIDLPPDGTVTARSYVLGADRSTGDCLPLGRHRFGPRVFWSDRNELPSTTDGTRIDWSFTLAVTPDW